MKSELTYQCNKKCTQKYIQQCTWMMHFIQLEKNKVRNVAYILYRKRCAVTFLAVTLPHSSPYSCYNGSLLKALHCDQQHNYSPALQPILILCPIEISDLSEIEQAPTLKVNLIKCLFFVSSKQRCFDLRKTLMFRKIISWLTLSR